MSSAEQPSVERYSRQVTVPGVGESGQRALAQARVLCIGAGGLGSPAALYLAAAGVGTIGIVDDDVVELSNLHRQVIHSTAGIGTPKTESAAAALGALNPEITVRTHPVRLAAHNVLDLCADYDVVVDGADNFATRYLVSDATTLLGIPHVWGSVLGAGGQLSVFHAARGPVLRDLFPRVPDPGSVPSCVAAGVLGVVPGIVGVAMAAEVLKLLLNYGTPLIGTVQIYDMATGDWDRLPLRANPQVQRPRSVEDIGAGLEAAGLETAGSESAQRITAAQLVEELQQDLLRGKAPAPAPVLIDVREPAETATGVLPGARLWPMSGLDYTELVAGVAAELSAGAPAPIVYCKSGGRSAQAAAELARRGMTVRDLAGGIDAVRAAAPELIAAPDLTMQAAADQIAGLR